MVRRTQNSPYWIERPQRNGVPHECFARTGCGRVAPRLGGELQSRGPFAERAQRVAPCFSVGYKMKQHTIRRETAGDRHGASKMSEHHHAGSARAVFTAR